MTGADDGDVCEGVPAEPVDDGRRAENVRRDDEPTFEAPWQARAFAVAVQLTERGDGDMPWETFQERLVAEIEADGDGGEATEDVYYELWLRALERLLVEEGLVDEEELSERAREFEAGDRDASEFVLGEHGHSHDHGHLHEAGQGHSHERQDHSHEHHDHTHEADEHGPDRGH